jgi:hypothetical protein
MFCAPGRVFDGAEGVGSRFHVLRSHTHFRGYRGCRVPFSYLRSRNHFRRYRGRRVRFSCFALRDSFSAVQRASGPVFMFCAPRLVFGGTEGRRVSFSCFALPNTFSEVPPKTSSGAQNMKTEADALSSAEKYSGSAKHENRCLRPPHRQKHV